VRPSAVTIITLFADYERPLRINTYGSGNDPLEIQFGAILKKLAILAPAPFGRDTKRILIHQARVNNKTVIPLAGEFQVPLVRDVPTRSTSWH